MNLNRIFGDIEILAIVWHTSHFYLKTPGLKKRTILDIWDGFKYKTNL